MKHYSSHIISLITILLICILYFFHLWYPIQKLIVTPDIDTSDAINLSLSQKFILAQSYTQNKLPLWENGVNAGFPMFAEGQIGALFLPNIILYRLFPFVTAYNISLVLTIILIAWGTYLWCRQWGIRSWVAFLAGMTMAFSGVTIPHLTHIALLQSYSLMPLLSWLALALIQQPSYPVLVIFAILLSQQVFAGFFQAAFMTWGLIMILAYTASGKGTKLRSVFVVGMGILMGVGLSAIQILPSQEFLSQTAARYGFDQATASLFSFRLDNFLTIFHPFAIGSPRDATYDFTGNSIFWENNIFLGIFPIFSIGYWWMKKQKRRALLPLLLLISLAAILMMGKYSPAYLIYAFWPMNLFRVPSRYATVFVFSAITFLALTLNAFNLKKTIIVFLILAQGSVLWYAWRNYHAYEPFDQWLSKPEVVRTIQHEGAVLSLDAVEHYKDIFLGFGFSDMRPYRFLRNSLQPYINILWDVQNVDAYPSRVLRRPGIANALMRESFENEDKSDWEKLLTLFSIRYVLSHKPIDHTTLVQTATIDDPWTRIYVYENVHALPRTYRTRNLSLVKSLTDTREAVKEKSFVPGASALVEEPLDLTGRSLQVIQQAWYPGWTAYVDSKKERVIPVNIRMSGVVVPDGDHEVTLRYEPVSFSRGLRISIITAIIMILIGLIGKAYQTAIRWHDRLPHTS